MGKTVQQEQFETSAKFSELFSPQPMSGHSKVPWTTREALERDLSFALGNQTKHICVDGPSGSGKTSLVQRIFIRQKTPFIHIQIAKDWKWADFTRQFVEIPRSTKRQSEASIKGLLNLFRPGIEGSISYIDELDDTAALELLLRTAETWRSDDLARWIQENKLVLIVDDIELASDDILEGLTAAAKLLGQTFSGRMVLIGIDDVLRKFTTRNPSLSKRISEVSVGGLSNIGESVSFIFNKFHQAGVLTPDRDPRTKDEKDKVNLCREYIYDAANGLMKDLNDLGMRLAQASRGGRKISFFDIQKSCRDFITENRHRNRKKIINIGNILKDNVDFWEVFSFLINKSASSITKVSEIEEAFNGVYGEEKILSVLEFFEDQKMIALTGIDEARVFFRDPGLFNCIRAHFNAGERYGWNLSDDASTSAFTQLSLPLRRGEN